MRPLFLALLVWTAASAGALSRLDQPDGRSVWLFSQAASGSVTLRFPTGAVPEESWVALPQAGGPAWVELWSPGRWTRLSVPEVRVPGLVTLVRVPRGLRVLTWHGALPPEPVLVRTPATAPPPYPARLLVGADTTEVDLPSWTVPAGYEPQLQLSLRSGAAAELEFQGQGQRLSRSLPGREAQWNFSPAAWGFTPQTIVVRGASALRGLRVRAIEPAAALPADPDTLLAWPADRWRQGPREWFAWTGTSVLVLVTKDYRVQDNYLRRLAFFVEKTGYRGRVVSDQELGPQHGWNAHDYAAADLAAFFTQAAADNFPLLDEELELRDRLTAAGIVVKTGGRAWTAGTGALVGVSAQSPPALRRALFVHEGYHGLYFTSPEFRQGVAAVWGALSDGARQAFRTFLARSAYDPSFEGLMVNEFQAYVLQRDEAGWEPFFRERVLADEPPGAVRLGRLTELLTAARTLDGLVNTLYGLRSGAISPTKP